MSRLRVGGLALVIGFTKQDFNLGKVVRLDMYKGRLHFREGEIIDDLWQCSGDVLDSDCQSVPYVFIQSHNLLPLGDKQTQDELMKEKEIENA